MHNSAMHFTFSL